jgi:nickel/cobalt transporter (NicO) family protein
MTSPALAATVARPAARAGRALLLAWCVVLVAGALWPAPVPAIPLERGRPAEAAPGRSLPAPVETFLARVAQAQRQLNQTVSREMRAVRDGGSPGALVTIALLAFAYGVLHAVGPGHGKFVVSSYLLAHETRFGRGLLLAGFVSLLQALSAITLVGVLALAMGRRGFAVMAGVTWLELVSYALIAAIGLYLVAAALRGHGCTLHAGPDARGGAPGTRPAGWGVIVAAGLTPCASAVIVLLFALAQGVFLVGIGAALVMAVGMALTVGAIGLLAVGSRRTVLRLAAARPRTTRWLQSGLALAGGLAIAGVGLLFLADAWTRLG